MPSTRRAFMLGVPAATLAVWAAPSATASTGAGTAAPGTGSEVGAGQSPIDIRRREAVNSPWLPALRVDYPSDVDLSVRYVSRDATDPSGCTTRGREETIEADVPEGAASVHLGDVRYELAQFHFHTPSEHRLDGHQFPLEQHFVHRGPAGELLVIGLLLTGGGSGHSLQDRVLSQFPDECGEVVELPGADLAASFPRHLTTFRYPGSLTTSPFTQGVSWLVLNARAQVSTQALTHFQQLFPEGDARDPQPLDGRVVRLRRQH